MNFFIANFCFSGQPKSRLFWDYFNLIFFGIRFIFKNFFEAFIMSLFHKLVMMIEYKYLLFNMFSHLFTDSLHLKIHDSQYTSHLEPIFEKNIFPLEKCFGEGYHTNLLFYPNHSKAALIEPSQYLIFLGLVIVPAFILAFLDKGRKELKDFKDALNSLNLSMIILVKLNEINFF